MPARLHDIVDTMAVETTRTIQRWEKLVLHTPGMYLR
jgi:hypothetical protein